MNAGGLTTVKFFLDKSGNIPLNIINIMNYFKSFLSEHLVWPPLIIFLLAPFVFALALSRLEITVAYPVQVGTNFGLMSLLAIVFLDESLSPMRLTGLCLIALGIVIIILNRSDRDSNFKIG